MPHKFIRQDFENLIQRIKALHIAALEISDEELSAALAFFRPNSSLRHIPEFNDVMIYYLLGALRAFRNAPPADPGDSPFSYRKEK